MTTKTWGDAAKEVPKGVGGGFMKFKAGQNKFRILSAPLTGYLMWSAENKPIRSAEYPKEIPKGIKNPPKYFWDFVVYNFDTKAVEILEITQASIIAPMQELISSEEWGTPTGYSLTVNRKGEGLDTEYTVVPSPAKATPKEILDLYKEKNINLEALLTGGNPFEAKEEIEYGSVGGEDGVPEEWAPKDETDTAF